MSRFSNAYTASVVSILGILAVAACLRAPITAVAPALDLIAADLRLGTAAAGMLTTLPLLAFAVVSPFAARLGQAWSLERALFGALLAMLLGIAVRMAGPAWSLYLGTAMLGSGIAVGNVLLPSLLKRDFPRRIAGVTAAYVLTMGLAAALGSALAVPLAQLPGWGWRHATAAFGLLPLLAMLAWLPQLARRPAAAPQAPAAGRGADAGERLWRSPLAWQVTLYLGLNSFVYYGVVAWLPALLQDAGYSARQAGSLHGLMQLATAVPGIVLVPLLRRLRDQSLAAAMAALASLAAAAGLLLAPAWASAWSALFGVGTGAAIILGLSFVSLRVHHARQAAALSGMAQCIGYLLAAAGPALLGALHDASGAWTAPLVLCAALCGLLAVCGLLAGRDRQIGCAAAAAAAGCA
ncbi:MULTISPECIES: MFS transporter [Bordetella]|uniref:MFS transporter n=1 Tax=Bordetella genomosp. 2 TaxID=1983456 RepID=A0A261W0P9_9BORD|nr:MULTISPECIES: MFS transporter [Bordetella]OZI79611.1 MFS transporter [Bordetella genomosp. 2]